MFTLISPPPGFSKIKGFNDYLFEGLEVCLFQNYLGNYAVVTRDGQDVKGMLCMSLSQADEVYETCVSKIKSKFTAN